MYAKIFAQIFDSSLAEDYMTRHVFMDLLVLADQHGVVDMTPEAIARRTNVPFEMVTGALVKLCAPDTRSRSAKARGARLTLLDSKHRDWGWRIVNFAAYRGIKDEDARREYMRTYMKQRRKRAASERKQPVNNGKPPLAHTEADIEAEAEKDNGSCPKPPPEADGARTDDPVMLEFPVKGKRPRWTLRQAKLAEYAETFTGMDVLAECKKARQWCCDNPTRQKTARGMTRFLGSWLGRANDSGKGASLKGASGAKEIFE